MSWSEMKCRKSSLLNYGAIRWLFSLGSNVSLLRETCQNLSQLVATWRRIKTKWDMNWASNAKIICVHAIEKQRNEVQCSWLNIRYQNEIKFLIFFYFHIRIKMFQKGPYSIRRIARSLRPMNTCSNYNNSRRNFTLN